MKDIHLSGQKCNLRKSNYLLKRETTHHQKQLSEMFLLKTKTQFFFHLKV